MQDSPSTARIPIAHDARRSRLLVDVKSFALRLWGSPEPAPLGPGTRGVLPRVPGLFQSERPTRTLGRVGLRSASTESRARYDSGETFGCHARTSIGSAVGVSSPRWAGDLPFLRGTDGLPCPSRDLPRAQQRKRPRYKRRPHSPGTWERSPIYSSRKYPDLEYSDLTSVDLPSLCPTYFKRL